MIPLKQEPMMFYFPQKPVILGGKLPQTCIRGPKYLEIDCVADDSMLAQPIVQVASKLSTSIVCDMVFLIEG